MAEEVTSNKKKRLHPRERANLFSHLFFCWELPFFYKGYNKQITENDLYGPLKEHRSKILGDKLEEAWRKEVQAQKNPSLWKALIKVFGLEFLIYGFVLVPIELIIRISQPILIGRLMSYYTPNQTSISKDKAYIYSAALVLASFLYVIMGHSYAFGLAHLSMKMRVAVTSLIYRKSLKLSQSTLSDITSGHVVNLLSNDTGRFDYAFLNMHFVWMAPLETLVIFGIVFWMLGPTAVIGIGILLSFIPFQMLLAKKISKYRMSTALKTDQRIRLMNEILAGVKIIKMYTWEKPFSKLIEKARKLEMQQIQKTVYIRSVVMACALFLARIAIYFCILLYVLLGGTLKPEYVYVLTSFHEIIRLGAIILFPLGMIMLGEVLTSVRRIRDFLKQPEMLSTSSGTSQTIKLDKVTTKWDNSCDNTLTDITLTIGSKELVTFIGPVGSGKSTLLQTILKEIPLLTGDLKVGGTISYASQQPWLFVGTIRDNILFGQEYNKTKYDEVVKVCALEHDFLLFPFGDRSLVGERGVLLSGGQKARISLARAIYKDADFYLLDDPLSAVDAHVGKQLFDNCIQTYLRNKTRVLVTHQLQYLVGADKIYLIENGRISEEGTYQELIERDNKFLKLLQHKQSGKVEEEAQTEADKIKEDENQIEVKENNQEGVISNRIYRDYFKSGGSWLRGTSVIILLAITLAMGVASDYFLAFWVNQEQDVNKNFFLTSDDCLYIYSGLVVLVIVGSLGSCFYFFQFCIKTSTNLHNKMFQKIVYSTMRFFTTNSSGRILNRFSKDMGLIDENLPLSLIDTIGISSTVVAIVVVIAVINPWILIPSVLMFLVFYYYRKIFLASSRNLKRIEGRTRSPILSHMNASLEGLSTIRAFNAQTNLKLEFDNYQDLHSSSFYMFLACDGAFGFWLDFCCVIYLGLITFSFLFIDSEDHGANVGLSITQSIMMTGLLQWGMKQSGLLENQMVSVERVLEYTKLSPEPYQSKSIVPSEWPPTGQIEFKNVFLKYSIQDPYILKNLSFQINPKEKIGIIGRTGAGKSSLVSAFFRLSELEGELIIDNIDIKKISLKDLRSKITIIPQEPILFSGTIRYNLDPFDEYEDAQLWAALEEVELKTVVSDLPGGLSSTISEGGQNLSVGQRQLLCLARAVARMNKILILDEATANVDPLTDELIQKTIRRKFSECTVLTIAHRLHTVMDCDRILVMEKGRVVEFDHPDKLLQNVDGVFYNLVQQSGKDFL